MGSQISPRIPVIDFTKKDMKAGTDAWLLATKQACGALEEFGCFIALYDKLSPEIEKAIFTATEDIFDLPVEIKSKNVLDKPYFGYIGQLSHIPLLEALGIDNVTDREEIRKFSKLMWPDGNNCFCETVHSYTMTVAELNQMVLLMICEYYGVEKQYDSYLESTSYHLRLVKHNAPKTAAQGDYSVPHHTDKTFLTLLRQSDVECLLEMKTKEGEWIPFHLTPSSFVVLAGDACMGWSNDRIRSCEHKHKVSMKETTACTTYTIGLSVFLNGTVKVPEELVDEDHPLKYKPFDNTGLIHFYASDEGKKHYPYTIKAYCGIET